LSSRTLRDNYFLPGYAAPSTMKILFLLAQPSATLCDGRPNPKTLGPPFSLQVQPISCVEALVKMSVHWGPLFFLQVCQAA
jgi:hypothetical protein